MLKKLQFSFGYLFSLLLLALCLWAIASELREYNYRDVVNSLAAIPKTRLSWAVGLTTIGYLVMVGYDILGFSYVGRSLSWNKIALTNFISCAFSNTIGFALLTGSAVRYRFYMRWGVSVVAIAQIIAFANFTFWLGMFTVAGLIFLIHPLIIPTQLNLPFTTVRPIGIIFLLLIAIYILSSIFIKQPLTIRSHILRFPTFPISLAQIAVSSLDWILAASVLYIIISSNLSLSYFDFLGIYLLAMFAAIVSNIPGGLGVFETVILLLLTSKLSAVVILGSLLAYRGIYYFLPLLISACLLGFSELKYR
ncbi:lysylphosphatidylglycerol synthase domain-containing protein [Nostoc sp. TCL26-01]|uniref:lysylphosphatidylglycerol synthase domain-containing protein n=1 Tax=Nostoc sp. TCL26-01 TaxID=2576904 RepID=UPI0015BDAF0B|nr:lysylphosphatidylglycerol synthase domain-containing protein [Nostoc sp. TCL26-01]QLE56839.1 UPF0104 family protein [Nostoc sp. TCL26-01]